MTPSLHIAAHHRSALGIALILLVGVLFATMDSSVKYLGAYLPMLLVIWFRYLTQTVIMGIWLLRCAHTGFRAAQPRFQLLRGMLLLATSFANFYGVQYMPVAEFTAINMLYPIVVTLLAAWVLHEQVSARRWLLVWGGFVGALIVIRPGSGLFGMAVWYPLAGALSYASYQVLTRKLAALENPYTTHFYTGLTGTVILTPLLYASSIDVAVVLQAASLWHLAVMFAIALLGTTGHLLLILALGLAPTATLVPFMYVQIAAAAVIGGWMFAVFPDGWAWIGMTVIAVCGATSAWLNMQHLKPKALQVAGD